MRRTDIIRAWRDPKFRASLSDDQCAQLPSHPAAWMDDEALASITGNGCSTSTCGGGASSALCTACPPFECAA